MKEYAEDEPILHVNHVCPACYMTVKPPVTKDNSVTWVERGTRHYAHARCAEVVRELLGVDNNGKMVTHQKATEGHKRSTGGTQ